MRHHEAGQLAELVLNRIKGNERCCQRRCLMSKDERTEELERRRWRKRMLNGFLLEEADESDNDSNIQTEEDGLGMLMQTFCRWIQLGNLMLRFYPGEKD